MRRMAVMAGLASLVLAMPLAAADLTEGQVNALYDADRLGELQKLIAEPQKQGNPVALLGAGALAARRGDLRAAFGFFKQAADKGNARAMLTLGRFYLNGVGGVAARDQKVAAEWIGKSHDAGLPEAALDLAMMHATGQGVERSPEKAVTLYREAADKGIPTAAGLLAESLASSPDKSVRAEGAAYARLAAARLKGRENRERVAKLADLMMESVDDPARKLADEKFAALMAAVPEARDTRDLQDAKNDAGR